MRPDYCVSTTTNGAWQLAHCEQRIVRRRTNFYSRRRLTLVKISLVPGGTSLGLV
jgi:hypothetical protein